MTIRKLIQAGAALLAGLLLLGGLAAYSSIDTVRIGGPVHSSLEQSNTLLADIMPPPMFLVEAYLVAEEIVAERGGNPETVRDLARLRKEYDARIDFWQASSLDPKLKATIAERSDRSAKAFWREVDTGLLPAAARQDGPALDTSRLRLHRLYQTHRSDIGTLVTQLNGFMAEQEATADSSLTRGYLVLIVVAIAILSAVGYAAWHLLSRVVSPMGELVGVTNNLARGANEAVPHRNRVDELGELARAVDTFRQAAEDRAASDAKAKEEQLVVTRALDASLAALKDGDLTQDITEQFPPAFRQLRDNFNEAVAGIRDLMRQVSVSTTSILTGAEEISTAANTLARRTEGNAASLEETNAALGGVDTRVRATAAATRTTLEQAVEARTRVEEGRNRAGGAVDAMNQVSETTKGIDSVIEGLDKIAFQTRVLAMNAAVEAGRAGEAGRGFAVVADLVSALAMRAEEEARLAREQLTVTQSGIFTAVEAVKEVDASLVTISSTVDEFNRLLVGISADNEAQSSALGEISSAVAAMDSATQENAAMVEETSAATTSLAAEVEKLSAQAQRFRVDSGTQRPGSAAPASGGRAGGKAPATAPRTPAWQGSSAIGQRQAYANGHL
jgi:methyl-accepting chemotaxis protein